VAVEQDLDALTERVAQLENLVIAIISFMGISRQILTQNYGVVIPSRNE
jgi:hypothetical protein